MKSRTAVIWIIAIVVVAGLVFGLPPLAKHQIEKNLNQILGQPVTISKLKLNIFTGTASIEQLAIGDTTALARVAVNIEIWPLVQRHVHIQSLVLSRFDIPVAYSGQGLSVAQYEIPQSTDAGAAGGATWRISIEDLSAQDVTIALDYEGEAYLVELVALQMGLFDTQSAELTPIDAAMKINGGGLKLAGKFLAQADTQGYVGQIDLEQIDLAGLRGLIPPIEGVLSLSQQVDAQNSNGAPSLAADGSINLDAFGGYGFGIDAASWQGQIRYLDNQVVLDGETNVTGLVSEYGSLETAGLVGSTTVQPGVDETSVSSTSTLTLSGFSSDQYGSLVSGNWQGNVEVTSAATYLVNGSLTLETLNPLGLGPVNAVLVDSLKLEPGSSQIELLEVTGANIVIERLKNGELAFIERLGLDAGSSETAETTGNTQTEPVTPAQAVSIGKFTVTDSKLEFVDRSVEPLVDLALGNVDIEVADFSLSERFEFDFFADHQIETGVDASLKVGGDMALGSRTGAFALRLANFEIHEIAPYLGSGIRSGRLQLDSRVKMSKGRVNVSNDVHIRNVKIDDRAQGSGGDQMSLATALFLLKDKDDVVELEVPIETDFDNFEIGTSDIIQTALLKAARTTAVAYAQYALQPFGSLLLAKDLLGAATRPRFEPVSFTTASMSLDEKARQYVEKLTDLLLNKKELTVTVCGYSSSEELSALLAATADSESEPSPVQDSTEQSSTITDVARLKALAGQRASAVRDVLLEGGVNSERIYACTATVEASGKPRVEIAL